MTITWIAERKRLNTNTLYFQHIAICIFFKCPLSILPSSFHHLNRDFFISNNIWSYNWTIYWYIQKLKNQQKLGFPSSHGDNYKHVNYYTILLPWLSSKILATYTIASRSFPNKSLSFCRLYYNFQLVVDIEEYAIGFLQNYNYMTNTSYSHFFISYLPSHLYHLLGKSLFLFYIYFWY